MTGGLFLLLITGIVLNAQARKAEKIVVHDGNGCTWTYYLHPDTGAVLDYYVSC